MLCRFEPAETSVERRVLDRPTEAKSALLAEPGVADALVRAAAGYRPAGPEGLPAFLYRTRLEAVRR